MPGGEVLGNDARTVLTSAAFLADSQHHGIGVASQFRSRELRGPPEIASINSFGNRSTFGGSLPAICGILAALRKPFSCKDLQQRRAGDSNPQPLAGHLISSQAAGQFAYPPGNGPSALDFTS